MMQGLTSALPHQTPSPVRRFFNLGVCWFIKCTNRLVRIKTGSMLPRSSSIVMACVYIQRTCQQPWPKTIEHPGFLSKLELHRYEIRVPDYLSICPQIIFQAKWATVSNSRVGPPIDISAMAFVALSPGPGSVTSPQLQLARQRTAAQGLLIQMVGRGVHKVLRLPGWLTVIGL